MQENKPGKRERRKNCVRSVRTIWREREMLQQRPHGLPGPLVVNLTSHAARFETLSLTLKCLLTQSVRADAVVLWLAEKDRAQLPVDILRLRRAGLTIRTCKQDFRSYNKIVHALDGFPDAFLVVADDDVYYPQHWLAGMVDVYEAGRWEVICHRARRIAFDASGQVAPYMQWEKETPDVEASALIFPTAGVSGALYRPGILHADTARADLFMTHAATADDIWLYFMTRMTGAVSRKAPGHNPIITWLGSQATNLTSLNNSGGGNDACWARLCGHYGFVPVHLPVGAVPAEERPVGSFPTTNAPPEAQLS